jgi:hypothetical protein
LVKEIDRYARLDLWEIDRLDWDWKNGNKRGSVGLKTFPDTALLDKCKPDTRSPRLISTCHSTTSEEVIPDEAEGVKKVGGPCDI